MKNSIKSLPLIGLLLVFPVLLTGCGAVREKEKVKAPETYLQAKVATEAELMDLRHNLALVERLLQESE